VEGKKPPDEFIKKGDKSIRSSIKSSKAETTTIAGDTKEPGNWSKLLCFGTPEKATEIEIIRGKDTFLIPIVESPKLRLKGRVFMEDIINVLACNEDG
jgi:hypothetical protein